MPGSLHLNRPEHAVRARPIAAASRELGILFSGFPFVIHGHELLPILDALDSDDAGANILPGGTRLVVIGRGISELFVLYGIGGGGGPLQYGEHLAHGGPAIGLGLHAAGGGVEDAAELPLVEVIAEAGVDEVGELVGGDEGIGPFGDGALDSAGSRSMGLRPVTISRRRMPKL
ncbi:hypothetical protein KSP40_PGU013460 [Platanthera guangdongensis]|uniref:Uncharacterized protein n=1 Tax=Platanthera guangdongensis TaxID=2320717 RepID=A0ABR2MMJ7_9ASPA